jgi:hypothetical protein
MAKAKESRQIQKARQKIKKQLAAAEKRVNPDALSSMSRLIQRQIARHSSERIDLKNRQITLFDENQHPAKTESRFISTLMNQIKQERLSESDHDLEGRIAPLPESGDQ